MACLVSASPALCAAAEPAARPLISLLLPLDAPDFARPALSVQQGCEAALKAGSSPVRLEVSRVDADPSRIAQAWRDASARGARVIVGPLTRAAVTSLSRTLAQEAHYGTRLAALDEYGRPLPHSVTLALNAPEDTTVLPPGFYTFGLVIEQEARAIARLAWHDGQRSAVVIQAGNALAKRASQAFAAEWLALGGRIADVQEFDAATNFAPWRSRLATDAEMIFLSADAQDSRRVRPYLSSQARIYATSQVHDDRRDAMASLDLAGIRFVDMPWLLQPDHPAVMVYPRREDVPPELQRFYALGIDACRIAELLARGSSRIEIDGVTGLLRLNAETTTQGSAVQRDPLPAMFDTAPSVPESPLPERTDAAP